MVAKQNPANGDSAILRVGCPMWANREWVGRWFPATTAAGEELSVYATWCTTVEGNTTFYASPSEAAVQRWAELAPADFRFCFKLPQHITHERRLRDVEELLHDFLAALEPLDERVGPIQIQLPATFAPDDLPVLESFLRSVSTARDWAVEVRHSEFFVGGDAERPLDDLLRSVGANRVILDSRAFFDSVPVTPQEREAWERKPRLPVRPVATGRQPLVRLIGQSDTDASMQHWHQWVPKLADWVAAGLEPHVFTHTPDNRDSPPLARELWAAVRDELADRTGEDHKQPVDLTPLPEAIEAEEQLGFFE